MSLAKKNERSGFVLLWKKLPQQQTGSTASQGSEKDCEPGFHNKRKKVKYLKLSWGIQLPL